MGKRKSMSNYDSMRVFRKSVDNGRSRPRPTRGGFRL